MDDYDDDSSCCSGGVAATTTGPRTTTTSQLHARGTTTTTVSPGIVTEGDETITSAASVGIKVPNEQDVLCGRGGSINSHPGNERFRLLVEKRKRVYLTARFKREKRLIASSIVSEIRAIHGRFLQRDTKTGLWVDIGDEKARDKTSQALRENAPSIRAEIEDEINEHHHHHQIRHHSYDNESNNNNNSMMMTSSSPSASHYPPSIIQQPTLPPVHSHHHHHHHPSIQQHHAAPPPPPTSQQQQYGWYHPSYYGYPPPVPPPQQPYPPPPPQTTSSSSAVASHYPPPQHPSPYTAATSSSRPILPPVTSSGSGGISNSNSSNKRTKHTAATTQSSNNNNQQQHTIIDLTGQVAADFVTSGAEVFKSWMGAGSSTATTTTSESNNHNHHHHHHGDNGTVSSQPISYKHQSNHSAGGDDHSYRRKSVKFRDDGNYDNHSNHSSNSRNRQRQQQQPYQSRTDSSYTGSTNSLLLQPQLSYDTNTTDVLDDLEPQSMNVATNTSLLSQVASHILGNFGGTTTPATTTNTSISSWNMMDAAGSICGGGTGSVYEDNEKLPNHLPIQRHHHHHQQQQHDGDDDEMMMNYNEETVEWEGQEVQLTGGDERANHDDDIQRMPPPMPVTSGSSNHHHRRGAGGNTTTTSSHGGGVSLGFSSLGSCHSWLPEQFAAASSYFGGRNDPDLDGDDGIHHHDEHMMMMNGTVDYNSIVHGGGSMAHSAAENYSMAGESIGGASLTKVFDHHHNHHPQQHDSQYFQHHHSSATPTHHHHHHHPQQNQYQASPTFSPRDLQQIPSWERSVRSRSPQLSFNDDDVSLISKTSSKGALSSSGILSLGHPTNDEMAWTRE